MGPGTWNLGVHPRGGSPRREVRWHPNTIGTEAAEEPTPLPARSQRNQHHWSSSLRSRNRDVCVERPTRTGDSQFPRAQEHACTRPGTRACRVSTYEPTRGGKIRWEPTVSIRTPGGDRLDSARPEPTPSRQCCGTNTQPGFQAIADPSRSHHAEPTPVDQLCIAPVGTELSRLRRHRHQPRCRVGARATADLRGCTPETQSHTTVGCEHFYLQE